MKLIRGWLVIGLLVLGAIVSSMAPRNPAFEQIKTACNLSASDRVVVLHIKLGDCPSCVLGFHSTLRCTQDLSYPPKFRTVAAVRCNKEEQLDLFNKYYEWESPVVFDDSTFKQTLGVPEATRITIVSGTGEVLAHLSDEDFFLPNRCEIILKALGSTP